MDEGNVGAAFQSAFGNPTKELLPTGSSIYKFNGFRTITRNEPPQQTDIMSPWWSPTEAFQHDPGLNEKKRFAKMQGVTLREYGRITSAVSEDWNSLAFILEIKLACPVYAWFGGFTSQPRVQNTTKASLRDASIEARGPVTKLAGGATQVMGDFVGSWLGTADLEAAAKDSSAWPNFEDLVPHMQTEINETFSHIMLDSSEQFASLYTGNYTFVNETLAQHYGIGGVTGDDMQRVDTTDRGGILANGAFMARWGEASETSPILRSVRVRRRMLCQDQPDPPAGTFAAREEKLAELSEFLQDPATTNRMKYHRLTEDSPCTNCHLQYINPLGFGMEDFDTVGRIRNSDLNGNPIDATGELYAPLSYSDVNELRAFLGTRGLGSVLSELPSAQSCLPKQMFRYFMGVGHQDIDSSNPEGSQLSDEEQSGYACAIDELTETMMDSSPRAMLERFGSLEAVRYRKAWARN